MDTYTTYLKAIRAMLVEVRQLGVPDRGLNPGPPGTIEAPRP